MSATMIDEIGYASVDEANAAGDAIRRERNGYPPKPPYAHVLPLTRRDLRSTKQDNSRLVLFRGGRILQPMTSGINGGPLHGATMTWWEPEL